MEENDIAWEGKSCKMNKMQKFRYSYGCNESKILERKSTSQPALLRHILIIPIVIKFQLKAYFHNLYFMMFLFDCVQAP